MLKDNGTTNLISHLAAKHEPLWTKFLSEEKEEIEAISENKKRKRDEAFQTPVLQQTMFGGTSMKPL